MFHISWFHSVWFISSSPWALFQYKYRVSGYGIRMLKIRRYLYIETGPGELNFMLHYITSNNSVKPVSLKYEFVWHHNTAMDWSTANNNGERILSSNVRFIPCVRINKNVHEIIYRQVSNIRNTLVGNKIVDHSDVVGASPVSAAPTTSSFTI